MRTTLLGLGIPMLAATVVCVGHAQELSPLVLGHHQEMVQDQGSAAASIGAGIGLSLAGFAAGAWIASAMASRDRKFEAAVYGMSAGGTFGMALGVHLGNRRRGNLALNFLTGAVVLGAGIGIWAASNYDDTVGKVAVVTTPIVALVSTVAVERAVGRSRSRRGDIAVAVVPVVSGGAGLAVSVAF